MTTDQATELSLISSTSVRNYGNCVSTDGPGTECEQKNTANERKHSDIWKYCIGISLNMLTAFLIAVLYFIFISLKNVEPLIIVLICGIIILLGVSVFIPRQEISFLVDERWWKFLTISLTGGFSFVFQAYALYFIPAGDAAIIINCYPAVIFAVSSCLPTAALNTCSFYRGLIALPLFAGIALIAKPELLFDEDNKIHLDTRALGHLLATLAAFCKAAICLFCRNILTESFHWVIIYFWIICGTVFLASIGLFAVGEMKPPQTVSDWALTFSLAPVIIAAEASFIAGLDFMTTVVGSLIRTSQIPMSFFTQTVFFHQIPDLLQIFGAILVMSCIIGAICDGILFQLFTMQGSS